MKIGDIIKQNRERIGMTRNELAVHCGVNHELVIKWEENKKVPFKTHMNILVHLFELDIDELLVPSRFRYLLKLYLQNPYIKAGIVVVILVGLVLGMVFLSNDRPITPF